ncbi:MAG: alpha/beta hydrolase [Ilumatobacteraceae bacterium]
MSASGRDPDARARFADGLGHQWIALESGVEVHVIDWAGNDTADPDVPPGLPPLLLVHGLASNARLWDGVARRLSALGHHVVSVDLRGHGQSSKPDDGYDMATVADDLHLLIDELGMQRPIAVGQSWGGNVVLELAARHPADVSAIACIDGGFIDLRRRHPDWHDAASALAPPPLAGTALSQISNWLQTSAGDWPEEGRRGTLANFEVHDDGTVSPWLTFDRHMAVLRGLWEHEPSSRYPMIDVPVLLVGADTGDVAWSHSKHDAVDAAVAALPNGRAVWFSPAHHDVHAEQPDAVAELLHEFSVDTAGATT